MDNADVLQEIIDRLQGSEEDILTVALLSRAWVPRSRYHFMNKCFSAALNLDSFEDVLGFVRLLDSSHCTLVSPPKTLYALTIDSRPSVCGPLRPDAAELVGDGLRAFLEHTTVEGLVSIKLDNIALQDFESSPFPWPVIAKWKNISHITLSATLPSLSVLTGLIEGLENLGDAELDVDYLDPSVPSLTVTALSPSFHHLCFGNRGHKFFSWLALFPRGGVSIRSLIIAIETEDVEPFHEFAASKANHDVDWLEVTFRVDRVAEFAQSLGFFGCVTEMTVALHFSLRAEATYEDRISTVVSGIDLESLLSLRFTIPSQLGIPWPLSSPTLPEGLDIAQVGYAKMRNHMVLAAIDQEAVRRLTEFAGYHVEQKRQKVHMNRKCPVHIGFEAAPGPSSPPPSTETAPSSPTGVSYDWLKGHSGITPGHPT